MNSVQNLSKIGRKVLTVGLSGVTCGGKSSITSLLKTVFPSATFICQDDFYYADVESLPRVPDETSRPNWDSLDSLDMVSMTRKVQETLDTLTKGSQPSSQSLIIIDGFLIFNYLPLAELCDLKYFITLPFEECRARRQKRSYDQPDPPGYFTDVAWPMYLSHFKEMRQAGFAAQIKYLDGTIDLQDNLNRILQDVQAYLDDM